MQNYLQQSYFGNTILNYIIALGIFILGIIIVKIFKIVILRRLKKWAKSTDTTLDDLLVKGIQKTAVPLLYLGALYLSLESLKISQNAWNIINNISIIIFTFFVLRAISSIIRFSLSAYVKRKNKGESRETELRGISTIISLVIWTIGLVFLLDNLGFRISAVITGLGIGGIAVALAAQAILGDLFAYFVIFFDRPFEIGDFITVADKSGTVEYVGLKTTRLRSLGGEQLVFSNKDLTDSRLHNYKRMETRRATFQVRVVYKTTLEQLKEIPELIKGIIEKQSDVKFESGYLTNYGEYSFNFDFVYYILSADNNKYLTIQQTINFEIYKEFEQRGIEFALKK